MVRCNLIFHKLRHFWKAVRMSLSPANRSFPFEFIFLITTPKHIIIF